MNLLIQSFIIGFSAASFPGPLQAIVFQSAVLGKVKDSLKFGAGIEVMDVVFIILSYYGLAQVIRFTWLFYLVGLVGVGYILFLGVSGLVGSLKEKSLNSQPMVAKASFGSGALLCVLSPYTYLFFIGYVSTLVVGGGVTLFVLSANAISLAVGAFVSYGAVTLLGHAINKQNNQKIIKILHIITALLMIFFAIKIFLNLFSR